MSVSLSAALGLVEGIEAHGSLRCAESLDQLLQVTENTMQTIGYLLTGIYKCSEAWIKISHIT